MRQPVIRKLPALIFLDIILIAVLIGCLSSKSNHSSQADIKPGISSSGNESSTKPEVTSIPEKDNAILPVGEASGEVRQNSPEETPGSRPDAASNPSGSVNTLTDPSSMPVTDIPDNNNAMTGKSDLPYYRQEYAERYAHYQDNNPDLSFEQAVIYVNIGLDMEFYEGVRPAVCIDSIDVLVNKYNKLPDDYKPELIQLPDSLCVPGRGEQYLRKEAAEALQKMSEDAKKEVLNICAYGTYRSIATQNTIWNNAINSGRTMEDVDSLNARGGHSEHHTGLAVDVIKNDYSILDTPEYEWYKDKAHEYGFIIRYPEGKEHITGYKYEPWHLRYVGPELAAEVYKSGLTYEEYYAAFIEWQRNERGK